MTTTMDVWQRLGLDTRPLGPPAPLGIPAERVAKVAAVIVGVLAALGVAFLCEQLIRTTRGDN